MNRGFYHKPINQIYQRNEGAATFFVGRKPFHEPVANVGHYPKNMAKFQTKKIR